MDCEDNVTTTKTFADIVKETGNNIQKAILSYCFDNNVYYDPVLFKNLIISNTITTEEGLNLLLNTYIQNINDKAEYQGKDFKSQINIDNLETIISRENLNAGLSEEDKKNQLAVIDILSYDPFLEDDPTDRPQLYRDMAGILTESMRKDVAKAKAALSVVRGYANLEKYQKKINEIMRSGEVDEETQKQLDQYIKVQKTLQDSINQTAEKNNFTVKGIGNSGKGMLSDVMNQIEEKGIDEGITNYYDISTSKAIEEVANISFKAQLNQVNLSKTDYADILMGQVQMVKEAQLLAKKAQEEARLAKEKLKKQELIIELENDYRKKGINESEIQEFINREYHLYDGVD